MRRKTKKLTTILDEAIADIGRGHTEVSVMMLIASCGFLSDAAKEGVKIEVDEFDPFEYYAKVRKIQDDAAQRRKSMEAAGKRFEKKARQHHRFSPHHDYWSYKAREACPLYH